MFELEPETDFEIAPPVLTGRMTRAEIKALGGPTYQALLAKERAARALYRKRRPEYWRESTRTSFPFKTYLCAQARARGRKKGLEATIKPTDLLWPSHCPVLGIELDYPERSGQRGSQHPQANWPSLDRWDSAKGYVPGNVFVISFRANTLKNSATYEEILRVAQYLARRPR